VTGKPVPLTDGSVVPISARTGADGYAAKIDGYFSKNIISGSGIELTVIHNTNSDIITDWYENKTVTVDSLDLGENDIIIELSKVSMATLEGTVTDSMNRPMRNVFVTMPQTTGSSKMINPSAQTDGNGRYSMQVAAIAGEVSFSAVGNEKKIQVIPGPGINTLDVTMPPPAEATVNINLETIDSQGSASIMDIFTLIRAGVLHVKVVNEIQNTYGYSESNDNYTYRIKGNPGDTINVYADGSNMYYGKATVTAVLNDSNHADINLALKANGSVNAVITDLSGNVRPDVLRYMIIHNADNGGYITSVSSASSRISCALPDGNYKAVLAWKDMPVYSIQEWEDELNCIITGEFRVESGKALLLGTQRINYEEGGYFSYNTTNDLTSSHSTSLPGQIITLRASYDYDIGMVNIDPGKLDLVAAIPFGATYVENSAVNRVTRGNTAAEPIIEIDARTISLDLKDAIQTQDGIAGALTYQVKVNDDMAIYSNIMASAKMEFVSFGVSYSEVIGGVTLPTTLITMFAPAHIARDILLEKSINLNGYAPANAAVELYDGEIRIGGATAGAVGIWSADVSLPDRGAPIYHLLKAKIMVDGQEYTDTALLLASVYRAVITEFKLTQGSSTVTFDPREGVHAFPYIIGTAPVYAEVTFDEGDRVENVKIAGYDTERQGNSFKALLLSFPNEIVVQYDEDNASEEEILQFDFGETPDYIVNADVEFVNGTEDDINLEFGADGYINSLSMPEFKITMLDQSTNISIGVEEVSFDPAAAQNYTDFGNGLFGYDLSLDIVDGEYVITAYLDRQLIAMPEEYQANRQTTLHAAGNSLKFAKTIVKDAGTFQDVTGAFGDFSKAYKLTQLQHEYEMARLDMQPYLADYYEQQMARLAKEVLVGKSLSLIGKVAEKIGKRQVVIGVAALVYGHLIDEMFDNEFNSDYNRLMGELKAIRKNNGDDGKESDEDRGIHYNDATNPGRSRDTVARPTWIMDPSGFVYEAVEGNRIEGVTATALYLPMEEAPDAAAARASEEWQFWDAGWYLQENPQTTGSDRRYAWDVPEGWWMVQFVKDGYQTAYSDALPVPPPQMNINVPMVKLSQPEVESIVWGSGGRYVDVYFSKYMELFSIEAANSVSLAVYGDGSAVPGSVHSAVPVKTGFGGLNLTRVARFIPASPMTVGGQYSLTVNKEVSDYAGFSMAIDYIGSGTVPAAAAIESLTGSDITVEPGLDITQDVMDALTFTPVDPADEGLLDTRAVFVSSNANVVSISDDGIITSLGEGRARITATSIDSGLDADFTVTVAYPPAAVRITNMEILDAGGRYLTGLSIKRGSTYELNPIITPDNATNKNMTYTCDNTAIATVSRTGVIQAVSEGLATITTKTEDQNIRQRILVKVLPPQQPGDDPDDDPDEDSHRPGSGSGSGSCVTTVVPPQIVSAPMTVLPFTDVKETDWFCEAVKFLFEKGITKGVPGAGYAPYKTVTRAEFITMLCRAFGIEERSGENYADSGSNWYTGFLAAARQLGLAQGVGGNRFEPERTITREEMVVILYNYFKSIDKITGTGSALTYSDKDQVSDWANEAVSYASANGWVNSKGNNIFDPKGVATRAELAQILYNILKE